MKNILEKDFEYIKKSELKIDDFKNSSILITGATGLIGSLLTRFFLYLNDVENYNLNIYAMVRNIDKANSLFSNYSNNNLHYVIADLEKNKINFNRGVDYIVHAAAVTKSKLLISKPVDVIKISVNGTEKVLDLAVKNNVKAMVYLSSMEVYGQPNLERKITESDLGKIDLKDPRSCYPEGKRICECLCTAYAHQYNLNVKIARLAQTFGAGILSTESRVFAQFARSIIGGEDIILHTAGKSEGNYVYTADAIKAILMLLLKGKKGQSYNVVNENNHTTIKNMAVEVIKKFGNDNQKVIVDIPKENMGYAPEVHMHLSNRKMKALGWCPHIGLDEMYSRMICWMRYKS